MFDLGRVTGAKFEQVSYKSGSETVSALLGKQVDAIVQNPSDVTSYIQSGRLRCWPRRARCAGRNSPTCRR